MGWERRGNGLYYYRAKKIRGRVVKEYVGTGLLAQFASQVDDDERQEKMARDAARREQCAALDTLDMTLKRYCDIIETTMAQLLEMAGFHRHHRGEWRRRRG